jgi:hypothetical protein
MPFAPGQSGNPSGKSKGQRFYAALDRAIAQDDGKQLRASADKLLELASKGEPWAVQMLADRLDGKPAQSVMLSGDADNPVQTISRHIVESQ